jgi:hypothetical protein
LLRKHPAFRCILKSSGEGMLHAGTPLDFVHRLVIRKEHSVSEMGSISVLRWNGVDADTWFGPFESLNSIVQRLILTLHIAHK